MDQLNKYITYATSTKVKTWIYHNLKNHLNNYPENEVEIFNILSYLGSEQAPVNLTRLSYPDAAKAASKWLEKSEYNKIINEEPGDTDLILSFPDGFKVVKLKTKKSYARESFLMHHCAANFFASTDSDLYSLRDKENYPVATVQSSKYLKEIAQIKGKCNRKVPAQFHSYLKTFVQELNYFMGPWDWRSLGVTYVPKHLFSHLQRITQPFKATPHFHGFIFESALQLKVKAPSTLNSLFNKVFKINYAALAEWAIVNQQEELLRQTHHFLDSSEFDAICFANRSRVIQDLLLSENYAFIIKALSFISDTERLQEVFKNHEVNIFGSTPEFSALILNEFPGLQYPDLIGDALVNDLSLPHLTLALDFYQESNLKSKKDKEEYIYRYYFALAWAAKEKSTDYFLVMEKERPEVNISKLLLKAIKRRDLLLYRFLLDRYPLPVEELLKINKLLETNQEDL